MKQPRRKYKVLVVEDNEDVRKVINIYLRSNGFKVEERADGLSALKAVEATSPDLVLLDALLPKMPGVEVLRRMRGSDAGARIPVVMMSGVLQMRDLEEETSDLDVYAYLQKPFQVRSLLKEVMAALERPPKPEILVEAETSEEREDETDRRQVDHPEIPPGGSIDLFSVPALLASAMIHSSTGVLRLSFGSTEKRVYFQGGIPVFAESSLGEETLGAHLVKRARITEEQRAQVQSEAVRLGRRFGETCLKMGFLGPHELFEELEEHLTLKVIHTFEWLSGEFSFEEGHDWKDDVIIARMNPVRIIMEGLNLYWKPRRVLGAKVFDLSSVPMLLPEVTNPESRFKLNIVETRVLQLVRRGMTVEELLREAAGKGLESGGVVKILYGFFLLGIVGFLRGRESAGEAEDEGAREASERERRAAEDEARELMEKRAQLAKELMAEYLKFRTVDYFKLLGLSRNAREDEITKAFRIRQRRYHPDTLSGIDRGLVHEKVEELFVRIHTAYKTLMDPVSRARYEADLDSGAKKTMLDAGEMRRKSASMSGKKRHELLFEDAFIMLRNGDFKGAGALFQDAYDLDPRPRYRAYRIWSEYMTDPGIFSESCARKLNELQRENDEDPLPSYLLGSLALREKDVKRAEEYFEAALDRDPRHIDSARQLRLLRMRKSSESSGLFDIFRKKD